MNRLMLVPLSICCIYVTQVAQAASPTIADDAYVADAIARNAIIWDVRPANAYAAGRTPSELEKRLRLTAAVLTGRL